VGKRLGDLPGPVLVHTAAIEFANDDAMHLGDGLEQAVGLEVEDQA
jgi:hypothetical protein